MATTLSVLKTVIPLNRTHVERWETVEETVERYGEEFTREVTYVHCRPYKNLQCQCPVCRKRCPRDGFRHEAESAWHAPDLNGVPVILLYRPQRIKCP